MSHLQPKQERERDGDQEDVVQDVEGGSAVIDLGPVNAPSLDGVIPRLAHRKAVESRPAEGHDAADDDPCNQALHDSPSHAGGKEAVGLDRYGQFVECLGDQIG